MRGERSDPERGTGEVSGGDVDAVAEQRPAPTGHRLADRPRAAREMRASKPPHVVVTQRAADDGHEVDIASLDAKPSQAHRTHDIEPVDTSGKRAIHPFQQNVDRISYRRRQHASQCP